MSWLGIALAVLALAALVPYVVGMLLRDDYEGRLDLILPVPPERVWEELEAFHRHPVTGSMARAVQPVEDDPPAWIEDLGNTRVRVATVRREPPRRLEREMTDEVVPMVAHWTFELEPDDEGGTRILARNRTVVRSGSWRSPIFRLILRSTGACEKVLREYFRSIAGALHTTATVVSPEGGEVR